MLLEIYKWLDGIRHGGILKVGITIKIIINNHEDKTKPIEDKIINI